MPNVDEFSWDETRPIMTVDERRGGPQELRSLRGGVRLRLGKEHAAPSEGGVGGEHKHGSSKCYYQASAPTLRPDGVTPLDSTDQGRLWVNSTTGVLKVWSGSSWVDHNVLLGSTIASFEVLSGATPPPLPITVTGLANGTWLVWVDGTTMDYSGSTPFTMSLTVNGVNRTLQVDNAPDGTAPFTMRFQVVVTAGSVSLTVANEVKRVRSMAGIRLGP